MTEACGNVPFEHCSEYFAVHGDVKGAVCGTNDVECTSIDECECMNEGKLTVCIAPQAEGDGFPQPGGPTALAMVVVAILLAILLTRKRLKA